MSTSVEWSSMWTVAPIMMLATTKMLWCFGIDIYAAQTDSIQLRLRSKPRSIKAFAEEVYEFCPDIVDQGIGSVAALAAEIEKSGEVYLWWD